MQRALGTPFERDQHGIRGGLPLMRRDKVGDLEATTGFIGYGYPVSQNLKLVGSLSSAFNAPRRWSRS